MSKKIIIVIDDDPEDIEIIAESVTSLGKDYECVSFLDACEALEYLNNNTLIPELIVIDINMPKMNGNECLDQIRKIEKLHPTLVAVYSSAIAHEEMLANCAQSRAIFFRMPSSFDALGKIFAALTGGHRDSQKLINLVSGISGV